MQATARALIDRPIEEVWDFLSTIEHMEDWVTGVSDVRRDHETELEVGAKFSSKYTYRGRTFDVDYTITTFDPPHRLDIESTAGPFPFHGSLRLLEFERGTEVSNTIDAGSDSIATSIIFTVLRPVVRRLMRRQLADELDELQAALDGTPQPGSRSAATTA